METPKLNTTYDFELVDGSTTKLTLAFYALLQLKSRNKSLYERYNKCIVEQTRGNYDDLDNITVLYAAYVCAHLNDSEVMSEEEFIMMCGSDREAVGLAIGALLAPKKQKASDNLSN